MEMVIFKHRVRKFITISKMSIVLLFAISFNLFAQEISLDYKLMDQGMFENIVVGNTIIGITRQSHSPYMLYFLSEGYCELWKQNQIFMGEWWIETDETGHNFVRAFWPEYTSSEPASLFSPQNPRYGNATSLRYFINQETGAILVAGKKFLAPVILAPGHVFPSND